MLSLEAKGSELPLLVLLLLLLCILLLLVDFKHLLQGCLLVRLGDVVVLVQILPRISMAGSSRNVHGSIQSRPGVARSRL